MIKTNGVKERRNSNNSNIERSQDIPMYHLKSKSTKQQTPKFEKVHSSHKIALRRFRSRSSRQQKVLLGIVLFWGYFFFVYVVNLVKITRNYDNIKYSFESRGSEKTTIVLMGYSMKRIENFAKILPAYGNMNDEVDQILFVWNNNKEGPPAIPSDIRVPIILLPQMKNEMNNRFGSDVSDRVRTDTVVMIDDDVLMSAELIRRLIDSWYSVKNVDQRPIVGIRNDARIASAAQGYEYPCTRIEGWIQQTSCWFPFFHDRVSLNLVIGKTMLFDAKYLTKYQNSEPMWSYTGKEKHFCEDILMNAMILHSTKGTKPILVERDWVATREILTELDGLSGLRAGGVFWPGKRKTCVKWANDFYKKQNDYDVWGNLHSLS